MKNSKMIGGLVVLILGIYMLYIAMSGDEMLRPPMVTGVGFIVLGLMSMGDKR